MKKFVIQIVVLLIVVFAGLLSVFNPSLLGMNSIVPGGGVPGGGAGMSANLSYKKVDFIDPNSLAVVLSIAAEVSDTPEKRGKGLSYRDSLDPNTGMIFLFDRASQYRFIMTGMRFPLDFIWIKDGFIVDLSENIPVDPAQKPEEASHFYQPKTEVDSVVEVNAGFIQNHKLRIGDLVRVSELTQ